MSRLSGYLTPETRATFEAVLAKLAAPGMCNPDDHTPVIDTTPDTAAIDRDTRSQAQRNHDGLLAGLRALIASGKLGQHNGLPVSIVVTTTLTDLPTQRASRLDRGHHHPDRPTKRRGQGLHRRRLAIADGRCDPHG